jgi:hypothetical protein
VSVSDIATTYAAQSLLIALFLLEDDFVADTDAGLDPIVALGTAVSLSPFIEMARLESSANPTDAGEYRKTEYTFFWGRRSRSASLT